MKKRSNLSAAISPVIENLEGRMLLSASFNLAPNEYGVNVLTVETGNKADNLVVTSMTEYHSGDYDAQLVNLKVTHNGRTQTYTHVQTSMSDVIGVILVKTGTGNDRVNVINKDHSVKGTPMLQVDAGSGNDSILCEGGFCLAEGGSGNDIIVGRTNYGTGGRFGFSLVGGDGNDVLIGSQFKDGLNGGKGNDTLIAGAGDDYVQFGEGRDLVLAGDGDDYMVKSYDDMSRSTILGGAGNDTLAVWTGDQQLPLDTTFSRLRIWSVENPVIDKMG